MTKVGTALDDVQWHRLHVYPGYLGFCCSEKAFHKALKQLKIPDYKSIKMVNGSERNATMHTLVNSDDAECYIVTFNPVHPPHDSRFLSLLVHEITHVKQAVMRNIGEITMSLEAEAYLMQFLFSFCMEHYEIAYQKTTKTDLREAACCKPVNLTRL